ncbi:MAG: hypothetical protein ABUT20_24625 [Bacteroidota bacterium]
MHKTLGLEYLLFVGYLLLFTWIVTKIKFFARSGFTNSQVIMLFLLKVMAGILYGWVGIYYGETAMMVDTWGYHYAGLQEYKLLHTHPSEYFTNLFYNPFEGGYLKFLSGHDSFWNELKAKSIVKLVSIFDVFSFGNYYTNIIFYSFITLFGPFCMYRVMTNVFPGRNIPVTIAVFLIPSFIYWTSGIHKEGLIFTGISLIVYNFYFAFIAGKFKPKRIIFIILGLFLLTILRNFLLVVIIPAIIAWFISVKFKKSPAKTFGLVYLFFGIIFFTAKYVSPGLDFPAIVVAKQREFLDMYGGSMVPVEELNPSTWGFIRAIPQALSLSTLRPYPGDIKHILSLAAAVEIDLILLLFILFLFCRKPTSVNKSFIYFCLFFSFTTLLSIGYTVNFIGAIVRYRSILLPFLVTPLVALTDWNKIKRQFVQPINKTN